MITHPKNVIKYCPRCGCNRFKTADEGRSFSCEECHFQFYINNSAAVACLIFDKEGRILLARRAVEPSLGKLDLPGGFIEPMENAEEAVVREIKEELNVSVVKMEYLTSFPNEYVFSGYSVFTLDLAFICEIDSSAQIIPDDDVADIEFIRPEDIKMEELCSNSMRNIINYYYTKYLK
jgi:mutator protein MutT